MPHPFANVLVIDPHAWRTHLLTAILRAVLLASTVVYPLSIYLLLLSGQITVVVIDTVVVGLLLTLYHFERIPFRWRAATLGLILYTLGTVLLIEVGSISQIYLFAFSIVITLLLGLRCGFAAIALSSMTLLLVGGLGLASPETAVKSYPTGFLVWTVITANFALIDGVLVLAIGAVIAGVEGALQREIASHEERRKLEHALHQSQKMEALGQLAGGVAHDFNNLLTVISGYSDILLSTLPLGDDRRQYVEPVLDAADKAAGLTRQLLAFGRKTVLEPRILDPSTAIIELEKMLRRLIGEDIVLTTVLDPQTGPIKVDPNQLGQILINLAINARDAMPRGGNLTIETAAVELDADYVCAHPEAAAGRFVRISVSDTGTGMAPEVKARAFEPFFTTKSIGKGTGLGLAMVHGIIRQSGGHIEVYSEVGIGTTFKLYLPASDDPLSSQPPANSAALHGTETILLVEDEDGVRQLASATLQKFGYTVLMANNGKAAFGVLDSHAGGIDMLVTDVIMPGMDGRQLADALRSRFPNLKVLYLSGYTDDAVVRHGVLQEEMAFLQKPFTLVGLAKKVRQVLDE